MSSRNKLRARITALAVVFLIGLLGASATADAQRFRNFFRKAKAPAKASIAGKLPDAAKFQPNTVGTTLKASLKGKTLMVAPKEKTEAYAKAMKNSVEVIFQPNASSYGHLLIRVGERMYDMPGPRGARTQNFKDAMRWVNSPTYGFVYSRTHQQVERLQREFENMANAGLGFSKAGSGPTKFSCAAFVTTVLASHAPELQVGLSVGAISAATRLLHSGKHDAVTLYGTAAEQAGHAGFQFLKLQ